MISTFMDAESLSRNVMDTEEGWTCIPPTGIKAIGHHTCSYPSLELPHRHVDQLGASPGAVPDAYAFPTQLGISTLEPLSHYELRRALDLDPIIGMSKRGLKNGTWHPTTKSTNPEAALLEREPPKLVVKRVLLYRKIMRPSGKEAFQLVLPIGHRFPVLKSLHDDAGHLGVERIIELTKG